jgi:hypothetical protein
MRKPDHWPKAAECVVGLAQRGTMFDVAFTRKEKLIDLKQ